MTRQRAGGVPRGKSPTRSEDLQANLAGVFAPICTPFGPNEDVDVDALRFNLGRYAESGMLGYLALGSNGENRSLTEEEKLQVLGTILRHKGRGQVVMAGATYDAQRDTERFLRQAADLGRRLRPGPLARLLSQADDRRRPVPLLRHRRRFVAAPRCFSITHLVSAASRSRRRSSAGWPRIPTSSG